MSDSVILSRYTVGEWLGKGDQFTLVDTPGFGHTDNDDNILINEVGLKTCEAKN